MKVAILGAGGGGCSAVAELVQAGHDVSLWARSQATIDPHIALKGVRYEGVLGEGLARLKIISSDIGGAIAGVDVAVIALPTFLHSTMARELSAANWPADKLIILNPGHTGGALEFAAAYGATGKAVPPIVEFSTLTYVARKYSADCVTISGRAKQVRAATLGGSNADLEAAAMLFPGAVPVQDVLAADLCNVNMVLHPPASVLAAAWVEATGGDFTFYVDATTPGVARVMEQLDHERLTVAAAFGHKLPNLIEEMKLIGTVESSVTDLTDYRTAISTGEANRNIKAPDTLAHRYYKEDFGHGLLPFLELAEIAGVEAPVARSLYTLAGAAVGVDYRDGGRTAEAMGIAGLSREQLIEKVSVR